jgi:hypothetical protein
MYDETLVKFQSRSNLQDDILEDEVVVIVGYRQLLQSCQIFLEKIYTAISISP